MHEDPYKKKVEAITKKLEEKNRRLFDHARMELLRMELYEAQHASAAAVSIPSVQAATQSKVGASPASASLVVRPSMEEQVAEHDSRTAPIVPSSLCDAAFVCRGPDLEKYIEDHDKMNRVEYVNMLGFVHYNGHESGIKKCGERYLLGLGSKASPLHFAALAARMDNVLVLLKAGAAWDVRIPGIPTPLKLAKVNGFKAVAEVILMHVKELKAARGTTALRASVRMGVNIRSLSNKTRCKTPGSAKPDQPPAAVTAATVSAQLLVASRGAVSDPVIEGKAPSAPTSSTTHQQLSQSH